MTPDCPNCPLGRKPSRIYVPYKMPQGHWCGLAIVGEQPAYNESQEGEPFVGKSGNVVDNLLLDTAISRQHVFITNAFQCYHSDELDDDEKQQAAMACRPRLVYELQQLRPQVTLGLGGIALKSLTNNWLKKAVEPGEWVASITELRGAVLRSSVGDLVAKDIPGHVVTSFHPSAILRGGGQDYDILRYDFHKAARWLSNGGPFPWDDKQPWIAPSAAELESYLSQRSIVSLDLECVPGVGQEKFNRWFDRIRMVGVGWTDIAFVIPFLPEERSQFYTESEWRAVCNVLRRYLADPDTATLLHNLQYDIPVLHCHKYEVRGKLHDTMAAHYTLYHMGVLHNLGYAAQQYLDAPPWKSIHGKEHEHTDFHEEAIYNGRDVRMTALLHGPLMNHVEAECLLGTYAMSVRNYELAWKMSLPGIDVNRELRQKELDRWATKRANDKIDLLKEANVGFYQTKLIEKLGTLKMAELTSAKTDTFADGKLTTTDVYALIRVIDEARQIIVNKKALRDLEESQQQLHEVAGTWPVTDQMALIAIRKIANIVKARKKKGSTVDAKELHALPTEALAALNETLASRAATIALNDRSRYEELTERRALGEELKKGEKKFIARFEAKDKAQVTEPNDLKLFKNADWDKLERMFRGNVQKLASKTRTGARRLQRYVTMVPLVNFASDHEAGQVIHGANWFGLPVEAPVNAKGDFAVDKDALNHLKGHPLVKVYQRSKVSHDRWKWLHDLPVYPDGKIHIYFKPGLKSGRWASGDSGSTAHPLEKLNGQNMEDTLMHIFTPRPGWKYVGADFSGLELRVGGVMTGCRTLIDQFLRYDAGEDLKVHAQTARLIWPEWKGLPLEEQKKYYQKGERYKFAKRGGFLTFYGGSAEALAEQIIGMEPYEADPQARARRNEEIREEANAFMRHLQSVWPEVFSTREQWYLNALRDGYLKIGYLTGRKLRFPINDEDHISPTLCANAPVQSTAGEIANYAFDKLERALPRICRIILYIHDCLIVECPEDMANDVKVLMKQCMEYYFDGPAGGLLCRADPVIGDSLHEVH